MFVVGSPGSLPKKTLWELLAGSPIPVTQLTTSKHWRNG